MRGVAQMSTHDRALASRTYTRKLDYIGRVAGCPVDIRLARTEAERRRCVVMTAYEIVSIFIGILALLMSFGSLVIALLAFLDERNKKK